MMGKGFSILCLTKQKLNTHSSTESELVGINDMMPMILSTCHFLTAQGYKVIDNIIYQDNRSASLLKWNGKSLSTKCTKHININYLFVTDQITKTAVSTEWCLTGSMIADFMAKPLQRKLFYKFHDIIMGVKDCPNESNAGTKSGCSQGLEQG